ncbi:MAG: phosphate signaling complex protein PhoU [Anaerolineales bacterium]|nr:phosphate signaling complex protein PhoU [Anaerolineales bacterium]
MTGGMRLTFDRELAEIQNELLKMSGLVDTAISLSLKSLAEGDIPLARQIIEDDEKINELRFKIEEAALALIATQQPTATDLRDVIAIMNVVVDIERMGDYATGVATTVIKIGDEPLLKPLIDLPKMVEIARKMLEDSVEALMDRDAERAKEIAMRDNEIDVLYRAILDELVEIMAKRPDSVQRGNLLLWCAHNVERIGDRATNIAERVVFVTTGVMEELNIKEEEL